jgi:hypothetical protein
MSRLQFKIMLEGLIATAVEMILVLGWEDAQKEVKRLVEMVSDLDSFWNSNGELSNFDWENRMVTTVEKVKEI